MSQTSPSVSKFDDYAESYDELHQRSVRACGESIEYFAKYKIGCLERIVPGRNRPVLDYGCGIGNLTRALRERYDDVWGYDPSAKSLEVARQRLPSVNFRHERGELPDDHFALAVLSGVLHHLAPEERRGVLEAVRGKLAPGGKIAIFEHNPWNPLTRRAVAACPFDDDAILLRPAELRRLAADSGFGEVRLDYIVFFPRLLSALRPFEPYLRRFFLGAQTLTIAERV